MPIFKCMSDENYLQIVQDIKESFKNDHILFYAYFNIIDSLTINENLYAPAAISFIRNNSDKSKIDLTLEFNPFFMPELDFQDWKFILVHELNHIIMKHPFRFFILKSFYKDNLSFSTNYNIAADVSINHLINDIFDVDRESLLDWKKWCWVETVFHPIEGYEYVESGNSVEYYLDLLMKDQNFTTSASPLNSHLFGGVGNSSGNSVSEPKEDSSETISRAEISNKQEQLEDSLIVELSRHIRKPVAKIRELIDQFNEDMGVDDGFSNGIFGPQCRTTAKSALSRLTEKLKDLENQKKSREAWMEFFKSVKKKMGFDEEDIEDSWSLTNRRYASLVKNSDIFLPTEHDFDTKGKMNLMVFIDTGKWCSPYIPTFKRLVATIPKSNINYKLFSFANKVIPANHLNDLRFNGGGSYINSVENFLLSQDKYPDAVLIVTDCVFYDNKISISQPDKWFMCITNQKQYSYRSKTIPHGVTYSIIEDMMNNKCIFKKK